MALVDSSFETVYWHDRYDRSSAVIRDAEQWVLVEQCRLQCRAKLRSNWQGPGGDGGECQND